MSEEVPEWYRLALQDGTWEQVHLALQRRARELASRNYIGEANEIASERSDSSEEDYHSHG